MPRSSRTKSRKHSSKEHSDSDVDVVKLKPNNGSKNDVVSVRVSKDVLNGDSDRWNGSDDKGLVVNVDDVAKPKPKPKDVVKGELRSSKRREAESAVLADESRRGEKRKSEKEVVRKEHKEGKEKERRRGGGEKGEAEAVVKRGESELSKRGKGISEWPIEEELRNPELEKELEKRMRKRGQAYTDKDKYKDEIKEVEDRKLSTRNDRSRDERHKNEEYGDDKETRKKDEKHREDGERDRKNRDVKDRGESGKYSKHRDDKYHEDGNKETKYKDDKHMETSDKDERSRDRKRRKDDDRDYRHKEEKGARDSKYRDVPEAKRSRDDNAGTDPNLKKTNNPDGPDYDDRVARNKDEKDRRRGSEKDEASDYRSHSSMKDQRSEFDKRSSAKADSDSERGRPSSRYAEVEVSASHSRRRSSPSGSSYPTRDHHHRFSKQEDTKYRDHAYEDRARHNVHSNRDYDSAPGQSDKKVTSRDDGYMGGDLSGEKRLRPDSRSSPQVDKTPSKSDPRKTLDLEEPGQQSGGYKDTAKDGKGGKGSRELVNELDNDNLSVSSPYTRNNSHFSGNSKSLLPPPSPSTFGSTEEDRIKSNNRHRRMVDANMSRGPSQSQGNWNNNVPSWPSPMASGSYIPFQHVPPSIFHPLMPPFPPPMFGRPPMNLNPGLPYHVPDHGRPPFHGWDANNVNNAVYDWDHRAQLSNRGWDQSGEMWNNQNAGGSMEVQSGQQKDGSTSQPDEGEQDQPDMQPELLNLDKNGPEAQKVTESPQTLEFFKEDNAALISKAYLSRVDVSKDLTQPELYDQCTSMMDLDQEALSDEFDCKILFLEEGVDADVFDSAPLFAVINDSVFQKAMSLYKKQKEELRLPNTDNEKAGSDDDKSSDVVDLVVADVTVMEDSKEDNERESLIKSEEPMDVEVDHAVVKQEEGHESTVVAVKESLAPSAGGSLPCEVEEASKCTDGEKNGVLVLSDTSMADVAVMPTESIECGSVSLNRIHHHSPESTH